MHWLSHWLGLTSPNGMTYLWWSGFFGDVGIIAAAALWLRHANCHVHGCWRLGRYIVGGTQYKTCRRCHPAGGAPSLDEVQRAHREANGF